VLVEAVGVAVDLVFLDDFLADEPRALLDGEEVVDVLAGLGGDFFGGVVIPGAGTAQRLVEVIERLEVQLRQPVELGVFWVGWKDLLVADDALDVFRDRCVVVLPVVDELLVGHTLLSDQQGYVLVHRV